MPLRSKGGKGSDSTKEVKNGTNKKGLQVDMQAFFDLSG